MSQLIQFLLPALVIIVATALVARRVPAAEPRPVVAEAMSTPEHPRATVALIIGILGVVLCYLVAPAAWIIGQRTVADIEASGGRWQGRSKANAGYVLGIVGTIVLSMVVGLAAMLSIPG